MNNRSGCILTLLALILACNIIGLYLYIDSNSRLTTVLAENTKQLSRINDRLDNLSTTTAITHNKVQNNNSSVSSSKVFANSQLRQPQAQSGGTRTSSITGFSGNLNDLINNDNTVSMVWGLCNDNLAARNLMNITEWQPLLAESWEVSKDGLVYTFKLRPNITWHPYKDPVTKKNVPAKQVTADDFVFWWECIQNKDIPCEPIRAYYKMLKGIEAVDKLTLKITWNEPYSLIEGFTFSLSPMPRHYYRPDTNMTDKEFAKYLNTTPRNQHVVGCGPYLLASWKGGESMTFKRYEDYYGPKPYMEKYVYKVIKEKSIQLEELIKGGIDDMPLLPEQWLKETVSPLFKTVTPSIKTAITDSAKWDELKQAGKTPKNYKIEKFQYQSSRAVWHYIGYNMKKPLFKDKRVRKALTMLTDRERILQQVWHGFGSRMAGPFVPFSPYSDNSIKPLPYDPEAAKKLLAEAGWKDSNNDGILDKDLDGDGKPEKFSYTIIYNNNNPLRRLYTSIVQSDLKKAGIDMNIQPLEWSVMLQKVDKQAFDACALAWVGSIEGDPHQLWHSSTIGKENSSNHCSFANAEADKLIDTGRREMNKEKRYAIYKKLFRILHEEQPYTFLLCSVQLTAQNKRFRNARVYKLGMSDNLQWVLQE